jgi:hypothetical protein
VPVGLECCNVCRDSAVVAYRLVVETWTWNPGGVDGDPWEYRPGTVLLCCAACDSLLARGRWRALGVRHVDSRGVAAQHRDGVIAEMASLYFGLAGRLSPPVGRLDDLFAVAGLAGA